MFLFFFKYFALNKRDLIDLAVKSDWANVANLELLIYYIKEDLIGCGKKNNEAEGGDLSLDKV